MGVDGVDGEVHLRTITGSPSCTACSLTWASSRSRLDSADGLSLLQTPVEAPLQRWGASTAPRSSRNAPSRRCPSRATRPHDWQRSLWAPPLCALPDRRSVPSCATEPRVAVVERIPALRARHGFQRTPDRHRPAPAPTAAPLLERLLTTALARLGPAHTTAYAYRRHIAHSPAVTHASMHAERPPDGQAPTSGSGTKGMFYIPSQCEFRFTSLRFIFSADRQI